MLKIVLIAFVSVVALFAGLIALQPSEYSVSREIVVNAPAERIFPHIDNARLMNDWNPWAKLDAEAKFSFSGPEAGVGARTDWTGGRQLGTGSATITESLSNRKVTTRLAYVEPMRMEQEAFIELKPEAGGTRIVWTAAGKNTFVGRVMCLFGNMDKMVGGVFEQGLAELKSRVETPAHAAQ